MSIATMAERNSLLVMALAGFASMVSMRMCDPMLVVLGQDFQVTTGEASSVVSAFAVAYGVMQLFYGPLGDRFGKLRVISLAALACAIFSVITSMAPSLTSLVVMRAFMGAAAAGIIPLTLAWIGDQVAYERRQETLARLMGATVSGMMVGLWFGGFAAENLGWRTAFVVVSACFATASVFLWREVRNMPAPAPSTTGFMGAFANTFELLRNRRVLQVLSATIVEGALIFGAMAFIPTHLHQQFDMSVVFAGTVMMLYGVGGLIYSQLARRWLGWLGGERGLVRTGASLIVLGLMTLAWSHQQALGMLGCFMTGFGFYMMHNTLQTQATQMAPHARGTAVTLFACVLFFGQSAGVLAMSFGVDRGWLPYAFSLCAVGVAFLGAFVYRLVGKH
ncbi:MFS transporter [Limnohabitans sp. MMS-10A-160]|uniref:MFS transporter n=1 Tax=unclassified Limnohabitans TaxID=2626134 RepID=UPI000D369F51|nr:MULTISPECIES: MFS transporter [unclassified Limnohabitans]PUE15942.1 MFS transporter [Limnohabitans sp. MMS-10A-192]PUE23817.1 MFS transporter [Limnohabitans sp. MMS-10A-160]